MYGSVFGNIGTESQVNQLKKQRIPLYPQGPTNDFTFKETTRKLDFLSQKHSILIFINEPVLRCVAAMSQPENEDEAYRRKAKKGRLLHHCGRDWSNHHRGILCMAFVVGTIPPIPSP